MKNVVLTLSFIAILSVPLTARANLITGVMNITGIANISLDVIGFAGNEFSINGPAEAQEGGFIALAGTTGTIENITNPPDATGPLNVPNFMTFVAAPNITITLTSLLPGIEGTADCSTLPAASAQKCT